MLGLLATGVRQLAADLASGGGGARVGPHSRQVMRIAAWDICSEPLDTTYRALLDFVGERAVRFEFELSGSEVHTTGMWSRVQRALQPWLLSAEVGPSARAFPTVHPHARLLAFECNGATINVLKHATNRLYRWHAPWLPDDPHFYRADGTLLMATLAWDRMSWLLLGPDELDELRATAPRLEVAPRTPAP